MFSLGLLLAIISFLISLFLTINFIGSLLITILFALEFPDTLYFDLFICL